MCSNTFCFIGDFQKKSLNCKYSNMKNTPQKALKCQNWSALTQITHRKQIQYYQNKNISVPFWSLKPQAIFLVGGKQTNISFGNNNQKCISK